MTKNASGDGDISKSSIKLFQTAYIDSLLKKHGLENANSVSTPLDPNIKLDLDPNGENNSKMQGELSERPSIGYAMLISSLMYLVIRMRWILLIRCNA